MTSIPIPLKTHPEGSQLAGQTYTVGTPMEAAGLLRFQNGLVGVFAASGEATESYVPRLEVYGTNGTLQCSDPNMYFHPVLIRGGSGREVEVERGFKAEGRGLGVAEMAWALRTGRQPRASGMLMLHALDIMLAIHEASDQSKHIKLKTTCSRPDPFDPDEMFAYFQEKRIKR